MPFVEGGKKPSFSSKLSAGRVAVIGKYERIRLQLRLIAQDVESDPKSGFFRYFMKMAHMELDEMQEQQNAVMSDYGFVFNSDYDNFLKNERKIRGVSSGPTLDPVACSPY